MIEIFPIDANDQIILVAMDDADYYVGLSWNETGQVWTLSLRNLNGEVLVSSIPAISDYPLLRQVRNTQTPPGELIILTRDGNSPGRKDFIEGNASLVYFELADVEEAESGAAL